MSSFDIPDVLFVAFILIVVAAALSDLARLTIPNVLPGALVLLFLGAALATPVPVRWESHLGAAFLVFGIGLVVFRFGLMGGGDVKFWSAIAFWSGLELLPLQVVATALSGGVLALALVAVRRVLVMVGNVTASGGSHGRFPKVLLQGSPVPYGFAISAGAFAIAPRMALFTL